MIAVELIEAATSRVIAKSELPPEQLPDTFEARTTLNVADAYWEVVRAEPMTREGYEKAGELRVFLRKIEVVEVDPRTILFSMPTVCDALPEVEQGTSKLGRQIFELQDDDWRQLELVAAAEEAEVQAGFAKIREVMATQRAESGGFKNLHLRKEAAAPLLNTGLTLAQLQAAFPNARPYQGLGYLGIAGTIAHGFAFELDGLVLYGVEHLGVLDVLALHGLTDPTVVAPLMKAHQLLLVDWCSCTLRR